MKLSIHWQSRLKAAIFIVFLVLPTAFLTGVIAALGIKQLDMLWVGALGGIALLALSTNFLIWSVTVLALLVVGQAMYFAGLNQAVWIPFGIGLLLFLRIPMVYGSSPFVRLRFSPPLVFPVIAFIAVVLISMLINTAPFFQALRAAKSYIFLWSIFFVVAYWGIRLETLEKIWRFFIVVAFIQIPLVLYQFLFVAAKRSNLGGVHGDSWDAIVGGFGGDPLGGGASGTMAWFLVFVSVFSVALYRRQLISKLHLVAVLATLALCVGLAEVKVIVILLPLGMTAILLPYLKKNPLIAILGIVISTITAFAILVFYSYQHSGSGNLDLNVFDILNNAFWYSLAPDYINYATGEMGRVASIAHWWHENGFGDLLHTLFGHGPGASSISGVFGAGEVARKYSFNINRSTLSIFLWDIGLVGVCSYLLILCRAILFAAQILKKQHTPYQAAVIEAILGGLLMLFVMLPYGKDITEVPALGVLFMLFLGYISQSASQLKLKRTEKNELLQQ